MNAKEFFLLRAFQRLGDRLTGKERAALALAAAALLWGTFAGLDAVIRGGAKPSGNGSLLYDEMRAALPDPDFSPGRDEAALGGNRTSRGVVYLTRPSLPGEPELEISEDRWIFFPRDYYTTININKAGFDELVSLPGIGPVTAWRIIRYRERYVGFSRVKALKKIRGIGDRTLERLEGKIRLY